jgi:hypothetical protein
MEEVLALDTILDCSQSHTLLSAPLLPHGSSPDNLVIESMSEWHCD